ncbi:MAG: hypothetical protein ACI94Y_000538 [Maribacter sp.]|jgi:hypothetical protein
MTRYLLTDASSSLHLGFKLLLDFKYSAKNMFKNLVKCFVGSWVAGEVRGCTSNK